MRNAYNQLWPHSVKHFSYNWKPTCWIVGNIIMQKQPLLFPIRYFLGSYIDLMRVFFFVLISQDRLSYLASLAQACLCLFNRNPLKASSFLLSSGTAGTSLHPLLFMSSLPTAVASSTARKEKRDRMAVTWNLGRCWEALRKTPWVVKVVQSH